MRSVADWLGDLLIGPSWLIAALYRRLGVPY